MSQPLTIGTLAAVLKNGDVILDALDYGTPSKLHASIGRIVFEATNGNTTPLQQLYSALNGLHAHLGVLRNAEIGGGK